MPAIRPIRFSALKALNPLHQEEERDEHEVERTLRAKRKGVLAAYRDGIY